MLQFVTLIILLSDEKSKRMEKQMKGAFMKTAVVTDTNSGIMKEEAERLGVFSVPMPVIIEEETFYEGENITEKEFYEALTNGKRVSTSQPAPGDLIAMWDRILSMGYDQIIHIPMSSGLSCCCETAKMLSADYDGRVAVADNHRISVTLKESVCKAKSLADDGCAAEDIRLILEEDAYNCCIYIAVDTLEYLKKGGRITPAAAMIGSVLNIKPILAIRGEKLDSFAKVRGKKKCYMRMLEALNEDMQTKFSYADKSRILVAMAGTALPQEEIECWGQELKKTFPYADFYYNPLSLSIGSHTGPGALGMGIVIR